MIDYSLLYYAIMGWFVLNTLLWAAPLPCYRRIKRSNNAYCPPAIIGGAVLLKGIGSWLGNKSKDEAAKAQQLAYNEWLKDRSKNVDQIVQQLKDRGIDIYGPQITYSNSQAMQEAHSVFQQHSRTEKTVGKGQQALYDQSNRLAKQRLGQTDFISPEERMAAESQINKMQQAGRERIGNAIGRMGLPPSSMQAAMLETPSDVAANQARLQSQARFADINRSEQEKARGEAANLLAQWQGSTTDTRGSSDSSSISNMSSQQSAPPDYMKLLAFLNPPSPNQPVTGTGMSSFGQLAGAVGNAGMAYGQAQMAADNGGGMGQNFGSPNEFYIPPQGGGGYTPYQPGSYGAGGGDFVTTRPTNITVGDNPGGHELVSIRPLSGAGQTRIDPASGLIALKRLLASRRA